MSMLALVNEDLPPPDAIHKLMRDVLPSSQLSANVTHTHEQILKVKETLRKDRDQLEHMQQQHHQELRWNEQPLPHDSATSLSIGESISYHQPQSLPDAGHPALRVRSTSGSRPASFVGSQGSGAPLWSLHDSSPASSSQNKSQPGAANKTRALGNASHDNRSSSLQTQVAGSPTSARSSQSSSSFSSKPASKSAAPGELLSRSRSMSTGRARGDGVSTPHSGAVNNISVALALYEQRGGLRSQSNAELAARVHQASDALSDWQRRLRASGAHSWDLDRQHLDASRRWDSPTASVNQLTSTTEVWQPQDESWQHERGWQEKIIRRHSLGGVSNMGDAEVTSRASNDSKASLHTSESRVKYDLKETSNKLADVIQHCRELQARKSTDTTIAALGAAALQLQNHPISASAQGVSTIQNTAERMGASPGSYTQARGLEGQSSMGHPCRSATTVQDQSPGLTPGCGALSDCSQHSGARPGSQGDLTSRNIPATNTALLQQNAELMAQLRQAQAAIKELELAAADRNRLDTTLKEARKETEVQRQLYQQVQRQLHHLKLQQGGASDETLIKSAEMRALDAEARCSTLQSEVKDLRMQISSLSTTSTSITQECESLKKQITGLHSQLAAATSRATNPGMTRKVAALEAELEAVQAAQQRHAAARRDLEAQLLEAQEQLWHNDNNAEKIEELQADLARVTSERDSSQRNSEEISRKLKDVEAAFERITRQMEDLHSAHTNAMDAKEIDVTKYHAAALARVVELEQHLQEADRKIKRLEVAQASLDESDKAISDLQTKLRKTHEQLAASQQLTSNLAEGNTALSGLHERLTEQQNRVSALQLQLQSSNMAHTTMSNDLEQKEVLVQELTAQLQSVREQMNVAEERAQRGEGRAEVLEREVASLRQQLDEARKEIDDLNKAGKGVTRDMIRRAEALERILQDHEEKLQIKAQEVLDARDTIAICEEQIAHFEDELAGLRSDYLDLNTRHSTLKREKDMLQNKLAATKQQLEKFTGPGGPQGRVRELEAQLIALQATVDTLKRERKEVDSKCSKLDQQLLEKEDMIIELDGRVTVLTNELERLYAVTGQS